jgi:beta-galactosidase GanA
MWSAIQPGPQRWDWEDFDRQFDLAERNGLNTVIAELTETAPEWVFRRLPHTGINAATGRRSIRESSIPAPSAATRKCVWTTRTPRN